MGVKPAESEAVSPAGSVPEPGTLEFAALKRKLFNAFDPGTPAGQYFLDLTEARGGDSVKETAVQRLDQLDPGSYLRFLFSGHSGGGKSSELRDLADRICRSDDLIGGRRFLPVYLDADDYFNYDDLAVQDLLLAIAAQMAETFREKPLEIELADGYFIELVRRARESLFTEYGVEKLEANTPAQGWFPSLKAVIAPLRRDENARKQVRGALTEQQEGLVPELNLLFASARLKLANHVTPGEPCYDDIVLIIDNLEKLRVHGDEKQAESRAYELFIRNAPSLTSLNVHFIFTTPLRAQYAFGKELENAYMITPFTMPMVAVEWHNQPGIDYPKGFAYLKQVLRCRTQGHALESLFTLDAQDWLVRMSGGHIRTLMILTREAISRTKAFPIDLEVAQRATSPTLQLFSRMVNADDFKVLAQLYRDPLRKIDTRDIVYRGMLEQQVILEYANGNETWDPLNESWYAPNPIVRQLRGFQVALDDFDREK